jgi:hypothetical protein
MRRSIVQLICLLTFLFVGVRDLHAQGCRLDYTPNYDMYTTETADDTYIYTTVLTDGSTSGNASAGCSYPNATHTASSYNKIGSTGGWIYGNHGYMTSYLSVENDQQVLAGNDGSNYTFVAEGQVICSVFGTFFSEGNGGILLWLSTTYGENSSYFLTGTPPNQQKECIYDPACSSGTPTCGANGWVAKPYIPASASCSQYVKTRWLYTDELGVLVCAGRTKSAAGPGPCD